MKTRIRMYRQGLGDCFLLRFDADESTTRVLIDCGVIVGTADASTKMNEVLEHITKESGGDAIDVVVATHEHWDHVSGFVQAQQAFDKLKFGEIWFAWTESPDDELANGLRSDRKKRIAALGVALDRWRTAVADAGGDSCDPTGAAAKIATAASVLGFFGGPAPGDAALGAAPTTKDAMAYLQSRRERKRYLEPGTSFTLPQIPDVRVYVLGPPRDMSWIKKTLPSKRSPETYDDNALGMASSFFAAVALGAEPGAAGGPASDAMHPFDRFYRLDVPKDGEAGASSLAPYYRPDEAWRRIDHDWLSATSDLAIALDNDTNNTSLVLAFELGANGEVLLFPGDAQVGNWLSWEAMEFDVEGRGKVTAADLLSRCVFYKVGHHASHNATLREKGLERMTHRDLHAMIPVDAGMAEKKGWGQMPFNPLLARLREKCRGRVIRSDEGPPEAASLAELDQQELQRYASAVGHDDLFIDLTFE